MGACAPSVDPVLGQGTATGRGAHVVAHKVWADKHQLEYVLFSEADARAYLADRQVDGKSLLQLGPVARSGALNSYLEDAAHMCAPTLREDNPAPSARAIAASETLLARLEAGQGISGLDKSLAPYARKLIQK